MGKSAKRILRGVITEAAPNLAYRVRLASGELTSVRIPHHIARKMFRIAPGDRVAFEQRGDGPYVVLGHEQVVIDASCVAYLTRNGRSVSDWLLVGGSICFRDRHGDTGELLTSDDRWYAQLRDYLRRVGAPEYGAPAEPGAAPDPVT